MWVEADGDCLIALPRDDQSAQAGHADAVTPLVGETAARALAATIGTALTADRDTAADEVGLASLLGARRLEDLTPQRTWIQRPPQEFLQVPLGVGDDGRPVILDLKESAQSGMGPHGLIVGATGSGKSELLRSLVLALCVTHHPDRLNVVMVDFKGGATFAELADLPHSAGLITNLQDDLDLVDRAREALFGELRRRQELLKQAGNLPNVTEYNARRDAGQPLAPLPSLLVIIDEFSELLAAKPDFADLFVAIGRIGRSIGVHLLLASQKLELGRVRGLETHLSYRVGLRTFSAAESREAIGSPAAYELPPVPGVGYLKVDTTTFAKFHAPYVGRPYDPDPVGRQPTVRMSSGLERFTAYNPPTRPASTKPKDLARTPHRWTELRVVVAGLDSVAARAHRIWLPPLAPVITLDQVGIPTPVYRSQQASAAPAALTVTLGEVDRPSEQRKEPLVLDVAGAHGNIAIVGAPQSGKSLLLRTLVTSLVTRILEKINRAGKDRHQCWCRR